MQLLSDSADNKIIADSIEVGKGFSMGRNVDIRVRGKFKVGDYSRFGDDVTIRAESVTIGNHFFHYTAGLNIGGGGSQFPSAQLTIGDRCVLHNNYINLAMPVTLGNDVGLSPDVDILTHGFWQSALEGYPAYYERVTIGSGVIVGQRSMILMGVTIAPNIVVGAGSVVTKDLDTPKSVYAGNPARFVRPIATPTAEQKLSYATQIIETYQLLGAPEFFKFSYPLVAINGAMVNLEAQTIGGTEDDDTDKFRDWIRRFGIRIYSARGFKSLCS